MRRYDYLKEAIQALEKLASHEKGELHLNEREASQLLVTMKCALLVMEGQECLLESFEKMKGMK